MSAFSYKLINEEGVSATTATPSVSLGTRRLLGPTEYVYAYNGGGAITSIGVPVIMTAASNFTFVSTFATGADAPQTLLGIVQNASCAAGSYCWVATRGFADVLVVSEAVAVGDHLIVKDGGGSARVTTYTSSITQLVAQGGVIGQAQFVATAAASGTVKVYIR